MFLDLLNLGLVFVNTLHLLPVMLLFEFQIFTDIRQELGQDLLRILLIINHLIQIIGLNVAVRIWKFLVLFLLFLNLSDGFFSVLINLVRLHIVLQLHVYWMNTFCECLHLTCSLIFVFSSLLLDFISLESSHPFDN